MLIEVVRARPPELAKCKGKGCTKTIEWVRTVPAGRLMPLTHPVLVEQVFERRDGTIVTVVDASASHFATCPAASTFRKKRTG